MFDMSSLMGMFGGGAGAAAPAMGGAMPPQGAMPPPGGQPGFGLGQQPMMGQMGSAQYAPGTGAQPGFMDQMRAMMSGGGQPGQGMDMSKLGPLAQMMMQHQQQQGQQPMQQMGPMAGHAAPNMGGTQASRGYLAQGGGIAPRQIINRGY